MFLSFLDFIIEGLAGLSEFDSGHRHGGGGVLSGASGGGVAGPRGRVVTEFYQVTREYKLTCGVLIRPTVSLGHINTYYYTIH